MCERHRSMSLTVGVAVVTDEEHRGQCEHTRTALATANQGGAADPRATTSGLITGVLSDCDRNRRLACNYTHRMSEQEGLILGQSLPHALILKALNGFSAVPGAPLVVRSLR